MKPEMDLNHIRLPRVVDEDIFEDLCADLFRVKPGFTNVDRNGRRGQRQDGVDVFGRNADKRWVGIQCKVRERDLSLQEVEGDLRRAENFEPRLDLFQFFTTAPRDAVLQEAVRKLPRAPKGPEVEIVFWDEIERLVKLPEHRVLLRRYFSGVLVDAKALGDAYGTLVSLSLGVDGDFTTNYELLIVKTLPTDRGHDNLDYHRGVHYLVDLHRLAVAKFYPPRVYPTELHALFVSKIDRYMVAKWLSQQDVDALVFRRDVGRTTFSIGKDEWSRLLDSLEREADEE